MRIALCNETVRDLDFGRQCRLAADLGYDGLELAPFTLSDQPHRISPTRRNELRRMAEDEGMVITGLHWLLVAPPGLSITSPDQETRNRTESVMKGLVDLCRDLGGSVLIHGSPKQRLIDPGEDRDAVVARAESLFRAAAEHAEQAEVTYCVEPLTTKETNYINSIAEAIELVRKIDHPAFRTMIDAKAASTAEPEPVASLCDRWIPTGLIAHVHLNDSNLKAPGQGTDLFAPVLRALKRNRYTGAIGVEPFDYFPTGPLQAARAIGYLRGILEALNPEWR